MADKTRILIIEDEAEMAQAIRLRLEANGYEVLTAADGAEGLNRARAEKPGLIILDVMLPKMDGFKVSRMLKFDENFKDIPIIMLTAKTQKVDVAMGLEAGVNVYMTKPFKAEELLRTISGLLAKK